MFFKFPAIWDNYPCAPADSLEDNIKIVMKIIEQIETQEEVSAIPEGIRELISWKVKFTDFLHQTYTDTSEVVSRPEKFYAKMNIFTLINEINKKN
jgi:hypothetical protein